MRITLLEALENRELYHSSLDRRTRYAGDHFPFCPTLESLKTNELCLSGMNYISIQARSSAATNIILEYSGEGYWACFSLEGEVAIKVKSRKLKIIKNQYIFSKADQPITINVKNSLHLIFICIALERTEKLPIQKPNAKILPPAMFRILCEIRQCTEDCPITCIFIESKILSLLYMIFEERKQKEEQTREITNTLFYERDLEKLQAAEQYIVRNIAKNYTLIELAHEVGLNDFKLKKGFKEFYGSTVFTYRHSIRMTKAMKLLKEGYPVYEVSEEIGYKHPHHFSAAFKAYFDLLPSVVRADNESSILD